ncbi:MAG: GTP-binding protein [Halobacteriovoraceae bacterium]|jgi:GTP-binding protein|nr:GTP-binding protein [Halobacteriovoraceae bacterium]
MLQPLERTNMKLKNIAIVAHVDHGKTTLVDGLLQQAGTYGDRDEVVERVMDSGEIERERGITITAKNCAIEWKDTKINLLDTPGHADFGGEVERSLMMVDGILLLVDASEGPLPQTRFVLSKAMEQNLKIGVLINKIDRPDERISEVIDEVEELFLDLAEIMGIEDYDFNIPFLFASAKDGYAMNEMEDARDNFIPLMDFMVSDFYPAPKISKGTDLQLLVTNLTYDSYLGSQVIGRIQRGTVKKHAQYTHCDRDGKNKNFKVSNIQIFDKLGMIEVSSADAGEIVILSGLDEGMIGDSICATDNVAPLERIEVDPPTVSVTVSVNTSPNSGREGEYLTSRKLEEFLENACRLNVALQYSSTADPKEFELKGRGELQLAIVFEQVRRSGYELMVARPQVVYKTVDGQKCEPFETVVMDVPNGDVGAVTEALSTRKGVMQGLIPIGDARTRLDFEIPSRGMIGYRSKFLTDTKGEGLMSSQFLEYRTYAGDMLSRFNGAIVADRPGKSTPYALFNLLPTGRQFIKPTEPVYEGQVVGEHTKTNDTNVNCIREKHLSSMRTAGKDVNIILPPIQPRTLEWAMDWIDDDEWVEVTPKMVRIRKRQLQKNLRSVIRT